MSIGCTVTVRRSRWLAVALLAVGCGASEPSSPSSSTPAVMGTTEEPFEFINSLEHPGAAQGLQAVADLNRSKHPNARMINTSVPHEEMNNVVLTRLAEGNPPDVIMWQGSILPGIQPLLALNDFLASGAQATIQPNIYEELLAEVTLNGETDALPWNLARANTLIYSKRVFNETNLTPPTTMAEFRTVCPKLKAAGVSPVGGFSLALLLGDLIAGFMGPVGHCAFARGATPDETALRNAIDVYAEILDNNYLARETLLWLPGAKADAEETALMSGRVAMLFTGDWLQAALEELGWTPGVDFGLTVPPGTAGEFMFDSVVLAVPEGAPHRAAALDFLGTAGSLEGHHAFFGKNSATSARKDVDPSLFDSERRGYINDLKQATKRCSVDNRAFGWEVPLVSLLDKTPTDKEAVLQVVLAGL